MRRSSQLAMYCVALGCCVLPAKSQVPKDQKPVSATSVRKSPLYQDSRLLKPITLQPGTKDVPALAAPVRAASKVRIYAEEGELQTGQFTLACANSKIADVLDATAALWLCRWQKDRSGAYKLIGSKRMLAANLPKNEDWAEIYRQGEQFMEQYSSFSAPLREKLQRNDSVSLAELPESARKLTQGMAERLIRAKNAAGSGIDFPLQNPDNVRMQLRTEDRGGFQQYFITLAQADIGAVAWGFHNYQSKRAEVRRQLEAQGALHEPKKFEQTQKEAKVLPAMQQLITLKGRQMTFSQVLREIFIRYRVSYVTGPPTAFIQRADVNFEDIPLGDLLDKLTKEVFLETEWEVRPSGFLVIRSPLNRARTQTNFDL